MEKTSKIYLAGHNGLVGSAIRSCLKARGYENLILRTHGELDLTRQKAVEDFFAQETPEFVFLAAAMVGGIVANNTYRADFIYNNIMIQSNVINACRKYRVKKLLFLGSTCIYPKNAPQPLKEEYLLSSSLEYTNEPYAIAKIAGLKMCESFNIQYGTDFIAVMPTNLYGPCDNYDLGRSHVLPALLRKIHLGKCLEEGNWEAVREDLRKNPVENINEDSGEEEIINMLRKYGVDVKDEVKVKDKVKVKVKDKDKDKVKVVVSVWGTGTPLREFMYSGDMAEACVFLMENVSVNDITGSDLKEGSDHHPPHFLNIGTGEEISVMDLAIRIKELVGFRGDIVFDSSKPDGTMRKVTDTTKLKSLGFRHKFDLAAGLAETYSNYLDSLRSQSHSISL